MADFSQGDPNILVTNTTFDGQSGPLFFIQNRDDRADEGLGKRVSPSSLMIFIQDNQHPNNKSSVFVVIT